MFVYLNRCIYEDLDNTPKSCKQLVFLVNLRNNLNTKSKGKGFYTDYTILTVP